MIDRHLATFVILPSVVFIGCDAVGVLYTKDPQRKLGNAQTMQQMDRPLAADLFIHEAIDIYKKNNDETGLAMSYKAYAFFLNNPYIPWEKHYRPTGTGRFLDPTVTQENHRQKAIEYLHVARDLFEKKNNYTEMTNVDFNLGIDNAYLKNTDEACKAFERSLVDYRQMIAADPKVPMHIPKQFSTYDEFIAAKKKEAGCP